MAINRGRMEQNQERKREPEPGEFVPVPGRTYRIRFLPRDLQEYMSAEGADDFLFWLRYHFSYLREDGTKVYNIPCPKTFGMDKVCAVCKEGWDLYSSPHKEDKELSKQFYRTDRALLNLLDLTDEAGVNKGVQWWKAPGQKVYNEIKKFVLNAQWAVEGKDILDLVCGRNFTVTVLTDRESGTGYVDYELMPEPNPFDVRPYLVGDWEERINSLSSRRVKVTNEDVLKLIASPARRAAAGTPPAPGGLERQDAPPPPNGAAAGARAPAPPPLPARAGAGSRVPPPPPGAMLKEKPPEPGVAAKEEAIKSEAAPRREPIPAVPEAPAAPAGGNPECFGSDKYSLKNERCVACKKASPDIARACREKFLAGG